MHAHAQSITATADPKPLGGSITAAMAHEAYRPISSLMARSGLEETLKSRGRLSVADVDAALAKADVSTQRRIELKSTLSRLGLLP